MSFVSLYTSFVTEVLTIVKKINIFEMTEGVLMMAWLKQLDNLNARMSLKIRQLKKAVIEISASFVK